MIDDESAAATATWVIGVVLILAIAGTAWYKMIGLIHDSAVRDAVAECRKELGAIQK